MNCRSRVCLSTPIYTNHRYNYKTPDLFSLSRIFTDLIMHNYRSNQSALMTRCGTDFRHQYGIFGGESQTSVSRNATRPGAKKDSCFRRLTRTKRNLRLPSVKRNWGKQRTAFYAIKDFNSLSQAIRQTVNLNIFKRDLFKFII